MELKESNSNNQGSGWTWSHVGGLTFGMLQVGGGAAMIICSGGLAGQFGGTVISSGFSGITYSATTDNFEGSQYIKQCVKGAATSLVCMGMGAGLSSAGEALEIGIEATSTLGKGAVTVLDGASGAVQYQVASDLVESAADGDPSLKRVREGLQPENLVTSVAMGGAASLVGSGIGHFQGKKPKLSTGNGGFFDASKGCLRTKQLAYKFKDKFGKQVLKDISKGIDSALRAATTSALMSTGSAMLSKSGVQGFDIRQILLQAANGAVGGSLDSRMYHKTKLYYRDQLQNKAYLKSMIGKLKAMNCAGSDDFNHLLNDTQAKYTAVKKETKVLKKYLDLGDKRHKKLKQNARNSNDKMDLIDIQLSSLRELVGQDGACQVEQMRR